MSKVLDFVRKNPYVSGLLLSLLVLALFFPVSAREGLITRCYYGEVLKKEVREVFVPWWLKSRYKVKTRRVLCSRHQKAEELYFSWRDLIRKGKIAEAEVLKRKIETLAGSDWQPIKRASSSEPQSSSLGAEESKGSQKNNSGRSANNEGGQSSKGEEGRGTAEDGGGTYSGDLISLLPASLENYEFFLRDEYPLQALAMARSLKDKNVVMVLFSVDRVDNRTAEDYLEGFKESYGKDWQAVKVDGLTGYWGKTSDLQKAILTWRRFDLMFVIELTTKVDAGGYRSTMVKWANDLF